MSWKPVKKWNKKFKKGMLWKAAENQIRCVRIENVIRYKIAEVIGDISLKKTTGLKFDYYWKK